MHEIAVLIPCYNEEQTIAKVVGDFRTALPQAAVYVYDNNSTDDTARLAKDEGAVVRKECKQGKGNVIRRMFREIDARCYIVVDGDDTYEAFNAVGMVEAVLASNVDMVIGDRLSSTYFEENKRRFHNTGNRFIRGAINVLFRCQISDVMTGYRALSYQFVKSFPVLSRGFEIETEMTIHAIDKGLQVESVVVDYRDRPDGSHSKLSTISDGIRVVKKIFSLIRNYRPLLFFGFIAGVLFLMGLIGIIPIVSEYFETGLVPRFPTLIVCVFVWLAAVQSFFAGLILDVIKQRNLQEFEFHLYNIASTKRVMTGEEQGSEPARKNH